MVAGVVAALVGVRLGAPAIEDVRYQRALERWRGCKAAPAPSIDGRRVCASDVQRLLRLPWSPGATRPLREELEVEVALQLAIAEVDHATYVLADRPARTAALARLAALDPRSAYRAAVAVGDPTTVARLAPFAEGAGGLFTLVSEGAFEAADAHALATPSLRAAVWRVLRGDRLGGTRAMRALLVVGGKRLPLAFGFDPFEFVAPVAGGPEESFQPFCVDAVARARPLRAAALVGHNVCDDAFGVVVTHAETLEQDALAKAAFLGPLRPTDWPSPERSILEDDWSLRGGRHHHLLRPREAGLSSARALAAVARLETWLATELDAEARAKLLRHRRAQYVTAAVAALEAQDLALARSVLDSFEATSDTRGLAFVVAARAGAQDSVGALRVAARLEADASFGVLPVELRLNVLRNHVVALITLGRLEDAHAVAVTTDALVAAVASDAKADARARHAASSLVAVRLALSLRLGKPAALDPRVDPGWGDAHTFATAPLAERTATRGRRVFAQASPWAMYVAGLLGGEADTELWLDATFTREGARWLAWARADVASFRGDAAAAGLWTTRARALDALALVDPELAAAGDF